MPRKNQLVDVFKHVDMSGGLDACWPWKRSLNKGRPYFEIGGKKYIAYRLVYALSKGEELPEHVMLRHKCDSPSCCNPRHLTPGSHQQNMDDMVERERHGVSHHTVRAIRAMLAAGHHTHQQIADAHGVSRETVTAINNNRRRQKVPDDE